MSFLKVDESKCTQCGICAAICPAEIVSFGDQGLPEVASLAANMCIKCGQCVLYCPTCANTLAFQNENELVRAGDLAMPGKEDALNLLKTRRSTRKYKDQALKKEEIAALLDAVKMAPTAVNSQNVRWVVTQTREKTAEAANLVLCWMREEIFKDPTSRNALTGARLIAKAKEGGDGVLRGAPHVIVAVTPKSYMWPEDGAIALTYLELAAHASGLGCCWGGFLTHATRNFEPLREFFGITEEEHICGAQMIGYPALLPTRQFPPRKNITVDWVK